MAVDKSGARVRDMFAQIARRYDFLNHLLSLNVDRLWRRRVVKTVPAEGDAPILDLCAGTGDLALAYFKATGGKVPIVAADFCREMLLIGQKKVVKAGASETIDFVEADALSLPFENDKFQIVCVAFGLRNVSDTDQALREMIRVCQGGGRVAVLEFSHPRWRPMRKMYQWYFHKVLPRIGQWFSRSRHDAYNYLPQSVGEFDCGEALARRMEKAGLESVRFDPLFPLGVATLYVGNKPAVPAPSERAELATCAVQ